MRRGLAARCLQLASRERGAFLWVPGLLLGTSLILFGIHQAPRGTSLFTRTTATRIVVGPWEAPAPAAGERDALVHALQRGLESHGSLELVDSLRVARRLREAGPQAQDTGSEAFRRVLCALNPHLALWGRLEPAPDGWHAQLQGLDVHASERSFACEATGESGAVVGAALAESVCTRLFAPPAPAHLEGR